MIRLNVKTSVKKKTWEKFKAIKAIKNLPLYESIETMIDEHIKEIIALDGYLLEEEEEEQSK